MAISGGVPIIFYIIIGLVVLGGLICAVLAVTLSGKKNKSGDKPAEKKSDYFDL